MGSRETVFAADKERNKTNRKWSQLSTRWIPWSRKRTLLSKRPWDSKLKLLNLKKPLPNSKRKLMKFNVRLPRLKISLILQCPAPRPNFKKILKNVTKPKLHAPRMKKEDVPVKLDHSLLNNLLKQWKLNLKKLNKLLPQPITSSKMQPVNARSLKVISNVSLKELKNSNQKHVTLKHKSENKKVKSRKLKPSLSRTPKKKINTKPRLPVFRKNSNWPIPELNSLKDLLTSSNPLLMVSLNH